MIFERWHLRSGESDKSERILEEFEIDNGVRFVRKMSDGREELKLMRGEEEVFDLMSLAPEGTRINFTGKWHANWTADGYEIEIGNFTKAEHLVVFLHEVGHLKYPQDLDIRTTLKSRYIRETKRDELNRFPASRLRVLKEEMDVVLRSEQDAWAFAFNQCNDLKQKFGIDILNKISGEGKPTDKFNEYAGKYLKNYEALYLEELEPADILSFEQLEEHLKFLEERESQAPSQ